MPITITVIPYIIDHLIALPGSIFYQCLVCILGLSYMPIMITVIPYFIDHFY